MVEYLARGTLGVSLEDPPLLRSETHPANVAFSDIRVVIVFAVGAAYLELLRLFNIHALLLLLHIHEQPDDNEVGVTDGRCVIQSSLELFSFLPIHDGVVVQLADEGLFEATYWFAEADRYKREQDQQS